MLLLLSLGRLKGFVGHVPRHVVGVVWIPKDSTTKEMNPNIYLNIFLM